ncbi:MAG TPA: type II toxin-antitoxin system ParD family antitoxin [Tepidisphaeraceae bacterium]|jgi:Arc/MetJ-type ribon-helix-helix transcriptional regulator|nr:type II toxin-antitoxin system ParD family antitoxin [Tepidisphaeraceae bacterium]
MQIMLDKPEFARFVEQQIKAGKFGSPSEVIEAGLERLMLDPIVDELDAEDLAAIEESENQIARGEDLDWKDVSARLRKKYLGK